MSQLMKHRSNVTPMICSMIYDMLNYISIPHRYKRENFLYFHIILVDKVTKFFR